jgi:hypothetical protein
VKVDGGAQDLAAKFRRLACPLESKLVCTASQPGLPTQSIGNRVCEASPVQDVIDILCPAAAL